MPTSRLPSFVPTYRRAALPTPAPGALNGGVDPADAALDAMETGRAGHGGAPGHAEHVGHSAPPPPLARFAGVAAPPPSRIRPRLFLGGLPQARDLGRLAALGVTHVVNVTADCPFYAPQQLACWRVAVEDDGRAELTPALAATTTLIADALAAGGGVLVHCRYGVSRSATVMIAYLMQAEGLALSIAYDQVRAARPQIWPNATFMHELLALEAARQPQEPTLTVA